MANPVAGDVVERNFHDELGAQALPYELLLGLPAARFAVAALAGVPDFRPSVDAWLRPALEVCAAVTEPSSATGADRWPALSI